MSELQTTPNVSLEKLTDTGLVLADPAQDIRNRKVVDRNGVEIGHVSNLFIDAGDRKVRMLEIRAGGFLGLGARHVLLPVDAITRISKRNVHVNETHERLAHSPAYDPTLLVETTQTEWEPFYGYYGLSPYWGAGYMYPDFPKFDEKPVTD
jgi:sporulation protein YlmC with PRC-barrel domain